MKWIHMASGEKQPHAQAYQCPLALAYAAEMLHPQRGRQINAVPRRMANTSHETLAKHLEHHQLEKSVWICMRRKPVNDLQDCSHSFSPKPSVPLYAQLEVAAAAESDTFSTTSALDTLKRFDVYNKVAPCGIVSAEPLNISWLMIWCRESEHLMYRELLSPSQVCLVTFGTKHYDRD